MPTAFAPETYRCHWLEDLSFSSDPSTYLGRRHGCQSQDDISVCARNMMEFWGGELSTFGKGIVVFLDARSPESDWSVH